MITRCAREKVAQIFNQQAINRQLIACYKRYKRGGMPATKFSRRTLLTAGSALAVLPFLRALPGWAHGIASRGKGLSADDGIASFKQAFADGQTVVVPPGWVCENIQCGDNDSGGKNAAGTGRGAWNGGEDGLFCGRVSGGGGAGRQSAQCDASVFAGRTV